MGDVGLTSRVLGVVAGARGDVAAATRHFEAAAREHEAAGANGWLAHTLADHAQVLIGAGDRQGGELVDRALALARAHGLQGLTRRLGGSEPGGATVSVTDDGRCGSWNTSCSAATSRVARNGSSPVSRLRA